MMTNREKSDSLMDQVFAAVTLPTIGSGTIIESHDEESHNVFHSESHHVETHHEHLEYTSGITVGNVVGIESEGHRRPTADVDDHRSEISTLSKASSVSVHSSVSQQSAQQYDLPPLPQYDMPPVVVGDIGIGKAPSVASSKGSHHSAASHHSHHSHPSNHSAVTHDSESTITEGTLVNEPIVVGGVVGSAAPTPLAVGQSFEHDAVIEQFKHLHGKEPSVISSIVPASVHLESDSEDSIAPSKLTHSITVGDVFSTPQIPVLQRSHEVEYSDFHAPAYYQAPSVQGAFDARSEDSFGFEKVEYHETADYHHEPELVQQVPLDNVIEQQHQIYEPYHVVHENHNVPSVDFEEDRHHSIIEHHHHHDHDHHQSHVTHTFTTDVKQSRSNTASTYQSRQIFAHSVGPKITEELRPAAVLEEEEVEVKPPVMAYVAPIPMKPPRSLEENQIYNAYEKEIYHQKEIIKSTTVVQDDIRTGSEGVSALRRKFEYGAPPQMSPVFDVKTYETQENHHHHHHHEDVVVEQTHKQKVSEHVQLGGSRKSTIQNEHHHHHHHHENHNGVPSRPSSVASSVQHQPHSRTSTVSTVRGGAPVQRVHPTVVHNPYGDHQSVRVVKNVREYVTVFGATHVVPPPTPLAGVPRLSHSPRSPISQETFHQPKECDSLKSSRKSSVVSIGKGVQLHEARKSTCSSATSSRKSSVSTVKGGAIVGGNVVPVPRSRQSTITQENVHHYHHDHSDDELDIIHVADMRKLFENYGPAHLPEYASSPSAYIH